MSEDKDHEFNSIIDANFPVSERKLLNIAATAYTKAYPRAKFWAHAYVPEYVFDSDTPIVELIDLLAFGIDGYFDFQFADTNLRILNLKAELTEADNNAESRAPRAIPDNGNE